MEPTHAMIVQNTDTEDTKASLMYELVQIKKNKNKIKIFESHFKDLIKVYSRQNLNVVYQWNLVGT